MHCHQSNLFQEDFGLYLGKSANFLKRTSPKASAQSSDGQSSRSCRTGSQRAHSVNKFSVCNCGLKNYKHKLYIMCLNIPIKTFQDTQNYHVPNHARSVCNAPSRSDSHRPQGKKNAKIRITVSRNRGKLCTPTILLPLTLSRTYKTHEKQIKTNTYEFYTSNDYCILDFPHPKKKDGIYDSCVEY